MAQRAADHFMKARKSRKKIQTPVLSMETAKRIDVTPPVGVLIFDTDTGAMYHGDGETSGGIVSGGSISELRAIDSAAASSTTVDATFATSTAQTAATNSFTATSHGLIVGDVVTCMSSDGTLTDVGLVADTDYTVATKADANTVTFTGVTFSSNQTDSVSFRYKTVASTSYIAEDNYFTWAKAASLRTGDAVIFGGTEPIKDADGTTFTNSGTYYIKKLDSEANGGEERNVTTSFRLATSRANALADTTLVVRNEGTSVTFVAADVHVLAHEAAFYVTPGVAHDIYLPDATDAAGRKILVKKTTAAYVVTVKSLGGTVDGAAAGTGQELASGAAAYEEYVSDGTNWILLGFTPGSAVVLTGDVTATAAAIDWDLKDNDSSALSIDASGAAGMLNFDTSNTAEVLSTTLTAGGSFLIDADTTDHTAAYVMNMDVGINSASVDALRINLDVGTALSAAEIGKGVFVDANAKAADANTSGIIAYDTLITAISTSSADLTGYKVAFDGTMDTADTITGVVIDGSSLTINDTALTCHGLEIAFASVTDTDYATDEFNAIDVTMPAAYQGTDVASVMKATGDGSEIRLLTGTSAGAFYGVKLVTTADAVGISMGACAIGLEFTGACTTAAITMDAATFANGDHEIEMRNNVAGDKTVICSGAATNDAGIVTAVGADNAIADGSLYLSCTDGAGALFIKINDVWTAVTV